MPWPKHRPGHAINHFWLCLRRAGACLPSPGSSSPTALGRLIALDGRARLAAASLGDQPRAQGVRRWRSGRRRPDPRGPWDETSARWRRLARGAAAARGSRCPCPAGLLGLGVRGGIPATLPPAPGSACSCWSRPPQMPSSSASVAYLRQSARTEHAAQISLALMPGSPCDGKKTSGSSPTHSPRPCHSPSATGLGIVMGSRRTGLSVLVPSCIRDRSVSRGTGERCPWACLASRSRRMPEPDISCSSSRQFKLM